MWIVARRANKPHARVAWGGELGVVSIQLLRANSEVGQAIADLLPLERVRWGAALSRQWGAPHPLFTDAVPARGSPWRRGTGMYRRICWRTSSPRSGRACPRLSSSPTLPVRTCIGSAWERTSAWTPRRGKRSRAGPRSSLPLCATLGGTCGAKTVSAQDPRGHAICLRCRGGRGRRVFLGYQ